MSDGHEGMHMAKRELIDTGTDKRYVRRDKQGRFKESDDVGRSLAADRKEGEDRGEVRTGRSRRPTEELEYMVTHPFARMTRAQWSPAVISILLGVPYAPWITPALSLRGL